jgi:hypothetical protein
MAVFVADQPFDAEVWSEDFVLFSLLLESEDYVLDEGYLGEDGLFYDDVYVREADTGQDLLSLVIAGEFYAPSSVVLVGDAEYFAVYEDDDLVFYVTDFLVDFDDVLDIFIDNHNGSGTHPLLLELLSGDDDFLLTDGDDWVETGGGADLVITGDGENFVFTDDGSDTIFVGDDADFVSGGDGFDRVVFEFARDDYQIERFGRELRVRDEFNFQNQDILVDVERVAFSDGALLLDIESAGLAFAYRIYAAAYGRTPDEAGLRFWVDQLEDRGGLPDAGDKEFLASFFLTADEFVDLYGANPSNEDYIDALYRNVLKREADQAGYDFWLDVIDSGWGRDDLLVWFADSNENIANTAPDLDDGVWVL